MLREEFCAQSHDGKNDLHAEKMIMSFSSSLEYFPGGGAAGRACVNKWNGCGCCVLPIADKRASNERRNAI
jgi:hypothetical protein